MAFRVGLLSCLEARETCSTKVHDASLDVQMGACYGRQMTEATAFLYDDWDRDTDNHAAKTSRVQNVLVTHLPPFVQATIEHALPTSNTIPMPTTHPTLLLSSSSSFHLCYLRFRLSRPQALSKVLQ